MTSFVRQPAERLILAGIAIVLIGFGLPQATKSLLRLAGGLDEEAPAAIADRMRPVLNHRAAQLESLDERFGDPQSRIRAGLLRLRQALRPGASLDEEAARVAVEDLRQGLARAPANPLAWTALSHVELALGAVEAAHRALGMSLSIAPHDPALTLSRCQVGLALWQSLSEDERKRIAGQIVQAWAAQPDEVLALVRNGGYAELVAGALAADPQQWQAFERALHPDSP